MNIPLISTAGRHQWTHAPCGVRAIEALVGAEVAIASPFHTTLLPNRAQRMALGKRDGVAVLLCVRLGPGDFRTIQTGVCMSALSC